MAPDCLILTCCPSWAGPASVILAVRVSAMGPVVLFYPAGQIEAAGYSPGRSLDVHLHAHLTPYRPIVKCNWGAC
jgi:hypothetical protein